jgi:hypothetical protein
VIRLEDGDILRMEVILFELVGAAAIRKRDAGTGFDLLDP